ncbi:hypothetical protein AKJ16_DCAP12633 [Drosera capensis]
MVTFSDKTGYVSSLRELVHDGRTGLVVFLWCLGGDNEAIRHLGMSDVIPRALRFVAECLKALARRSHLLPLIQKFEPSCHCIQVFLSVSPNSTARYEIYPFLLGILREVIPGS